MLGMFGFSWFKIGAFGLVGLILAAIVGYYFWSQSQLQELRDDLTAQKFINQVQEREIQETREIREALREERKRLNERFSQIEESTSELEKLLAEHDLGKLASEKPGLIEKRVNDGTKELFNELETLTRENNE